MPILIPGYSISGNAGIADAVVYYVSAALALESGGHFLLEDNSGDYLILEDAVFGSVTADGSGNYTISDLTSDTYVVMPQLSPYTFTPISQTVTLTTTNPNVTGVNFTANTTYSILGNVGTAGVLITYTGSSSGSVTSISGGSFTIPGLSNGNYVVTPSLTGYTFSPINQSVTVSSADVTGVNFTSNVTTFSIAGNAGLSLATVAYSGTSSGSVTCDGFGNFTITGLTDGAYTLTPSSTGYAFTPSSQAETVSGSNIGGVIFSASPTVTYSISGNAGIAAALITWTGISTGSIVCDGSGNFTIPSLGNGAYTITPSLAGYAFSPSSSNETVSGSNITGVDFTASTGFTIAGSVFGLNGIPNVSVGYVQTEALMGGKVGLVSGSVMTNNLGKYQIPNLGSGTYVVTPTINGGTANPSSYTLVIAGPANANFSVSGPTGPMTTWLGAITTFVGQIANIDQTGRSSVKFAVADMLYILNRPSPPNLIQSQCRHMLFDPNCALVSSPYVITTTCAAGSFPIQITTAAILKYVVTGLASAYYHLGTVLFTSGQNAGLMFTIKAQLSTNTLQLNSPTPFPIAVGDAITILPGCDKLLQTCVTKFDNEIHYGGMPFVPNPEIAT